MYPKQEPTNYRSPSIGTERGRLPSDNIMELDETTRVHGGNEWREARKRRAMELLSTVLNSLGRHHENRMIMTPYHCAHSELHNLCEHIP